MYSPYIKGIILDIIGFEFIKWFSVLLFATLVEYFQIVTMVAITTVRNGSKND
jgi:hypothetical protein